MLLFADDVTDVDDVTPGGKDIFPKSRPYSRSKISDDLADVSEGGFDDINGGFDDVIVSGGLAALDRDNGR